MAAAWPRLERVVDRRPAGHHLAAEGGDDRDRADDDQSGDQDVLQHGRPALVGEQPAAVSLRPEISDALEALREVGAEAAFVTGSGPTAVGLFADIVAADRAFGELGPKWADAIVTASVPRP